MSDFFNLSDIGLTTDTSSLLNVWQTYLQDIYPGYVPQPGNLEYIMAVVFAMWAADIANLCSSGGTELFIQYGQKLFNLPMQTGVSATAVVTVTTVDNQGYTIPTGLQLLLDSVAGFQTFQTYTIPAGSTQIQIPVAATTPGSFANGLGNQSVILNQAVSWIQNVTISTVSAGGIDPETADEYVQRLAQTIQIAAPRPVTASDFATMSLDFNPTAGTDQEEVGRATALDGYNPAATNFIGNVTANSLNITGVAQTTGISINSIISGAGIPLGATVVEINGSSASTAQASAGSNTITISSSASATATGVALTSTGTYFNERTVSVCVTDANGLALNTDTMNALQSWLESMREINFIVNAVSPTYNPIYVSVSVYRNQLYDAATVQQNIQITLLSLLTPSGWGVAPDSSGSVWWNVTGIYQSVIEAAIQNTAGVDHIKTGSLSVGLTSPPPSGGGDTTLVGAFPLPYSSTTTIPLSAITVLN